MKDETIPKFQRDKIFHDAMVWQDDLFSGLNKKISECEDKHEIVLLKETALCFLIFSLQSMIVTSGFPNEKIESLADHVRDQILKCKSK